MGRYKLSITAEEVENVATIQPMNGTQDPNFSFYFKLRCENCGEETEKESCVCLKDEFPIPKTSDFANLVQKCKLCDRKGYIKMIPLMNRWGDASRALTNADCQAEEYVPLMAFICRGLEPFDVVFRGPQWKVQSTSGTIFKNVDLSRSDWADYDEKGKRPVVISNLKSKLVVMTEYIFFQDGQCVRFW